MYVCVCVYVECMPKRADQKCNNLIVINASLYGVSQMFNNRYFIVVHWL